MKLLTSLLLPAVLFAAPRQDATGPRLASSAAPRAPHFVETFQAAGRYILRDGRANAFVDAHGVTLTLRGDSSAWALRWGVDGASASVLSPRDPKSAQVNYFLGNDPGRWKTGLPTYGALACTFPDIDLEIRACAHGIKSTLVLDAGLDPASVRLRYDGAENLVVSNDGQALTIVTGVGTLGEAGLACWQDGRPLVSRFSSLRREGPASWTYAIEIDGVDPALPLVIDPTLTWGSFLGGFNGLGNGLDFVEDVAAAPNGDLVAVSWTGSEDFPLSAGAFDIDLLGADGTGDAAVTRIDPAAAVDSQVLWSTFLGGSKDDSESSIAVDDTGAVYLCGMTTSTDFPLASAFQAAPAGAYVAKFAATGDIAWSSYLSGMGVAPHDIAVDSVHDVLVAGGKLAKIAANGGSVLWTYTPTKLEFMAVAVAADKSVYVAGKTWDSVFPATPGAYDTTFAGGGGAPAWPDGLDAFAMKVKENEVGQPALQWASLLGGGTGTDAALAIALDPAGDVVVAGNTTSTDFPVALDAWQATVSSPVVSFVSTLKGDGSALLGSTYVNGVNLVGLALSATGEIYAVGTIGAPNIATDPVFPGTAQGFQPAYGGSATDGLVAKFSRGGSGLLWSSFLGGGRNGLPGESMLKADLVTAAAVTPSGRLVVAGYTYSADFPVPDGFDTDCDGPIPCDGFVVTVSDPNPMSVTSLAFTAELGGPAPASKPLTYTAISGAAQWTASDDAGWLQVGPGSGALAAGATATLTVTVNPAGLVAGTHVGRISVVDADHPSTIGAAIVTLTITVPPPQPTPVPTPSPTTPPSDGKKDSCPASATGQFALVAGTLLIFAAVRRIR